RALAAALAYLHAGAFDIALGLLARAEAHAVDDLQRARVEQLRGQVEWASVTGGEAPVLLLQAARRLETLDAELARETYLYAWVALSARHVELARALGALAPLSIALNGRGSVATHCGDFEIATSLAAEKDVVNEVTGIRLATTCDLLLGGYRGRPAEAVPLFTATMEDSAARGEGLAVMMANWSAAVLH